MLILLCQWIQAGKDLKDFLKDNEGLLIREELSWRFLTNLLFQCSNLEASLPVYRKVSQTKAVPLIMNCQSSFEFEKNEKMIPVKLVEQVMEEGVGIFQYGWRNSSSPMGKSKFLNYLLEREVFETDDKNIFSNGHVDVFFDRQGQVYLDG